MHKAKLTWETEYRLAFEMALRLYQEIRKASQREGIEQAKAKGKRFGRPPKLDHKKVVDLWNEKTSVIRIAQCMNISRSMVYKVLHQEGVLGEN